MSWAVCCVLLSLHGAVSLCILKCIDYEAFQTLNFFFFPYSSDSLNEKNIPRIYRRNTLKVSGSFGRELADDHKHVIVTEVLLDSCSVVTSRKYFLQYNPPTTQSSCLSFDRAEHSAEIHSFNSEGIGKK